MFAYLSWHGLCLGFSHGRCLLDHLVSRSRSSSRLICFYPCSSCESSLLSTLVLPYAVALCGISGTVWGGFLDLRSMGDVAASASAHNSDNSRRATLLRFAWCSIAITRNDQRSRLITTARNLRSEILLIFLHWARLGAARHHFHTRTSQRGGANS